MLHWQVRLESPRRKLHVSCMRLLICWLQGSAEQSELGVVDQMTPTCFCRGYLKTTADCHQATDTAPFVTGKQNLILEGSALDVINEKGTGAKTPQRTEWLKSDTQLHSLFKFKHLLVLNFKIKKKSLWVIKSLIMVVMKSACTEPDRYSHEEVVEEAFQSSRSL